MFSEYGEVADCYMPRDHTTGAAVGAGCSPMLDHNHRCGDRGRVQPLARAGCSSLQLACSLSCIRSQTPPPSVADPATYGRRQEPRLRLYPVP